VALQANHSTSGVGVPQMKDELDLTRIPASTISTLPWMFVAVPFLTLSTFDGSWTFGRWGLSQIFPYLPHSWLGQEWRDLVGFAPSGNFLDKSIMSLAPSGNFLDKSIMSLGDFK
jgi:hypothetical protein